MAAGPSSPAMLAFRGSPSVPSCFRQTMWSANIEGGISQPQKGRQKTNDVKISAITFSHIIILCIQWPTFERIKMGWKIENIVITITLKLRNIQDHFPEIS